MNIRELTEQFEIQGAYHIKRWREDWNDYATLAIGTDFECDKWDIAEEVFEDKISYMYAVDGVLHIEIEYDF